MENQNEFDLIKKHAEDFTKEIEGKTQAQIDEIKEKFNDEIMKLRDEISKSKKELAFTKKQDAWNYVYEKEIEQKLFSKQPFEISIKALTTPENASFNSWLDALVPSPTEFGYSLLDKLTNVSITGANMYVPVSNVTDNYINTTALSTSTITVTAPSGAITTVMTDFAIDDKHPRNSVSALMPGLIRDSFAEIYRKMEAAVINGDTAGTHMDHGYNTAGDIRKVYEGLRKVALAAAARYTAVGSGPSDTNTIALRKKLLGGGMNPEEVLYVCDTGTFYSLLAASTAIQPISAMGSLATLMTGTILKYFGSDFVVSSQVPLTHTDGLVNATGGNNTKGSMIVLNKKAHYIGKGTDVIVKFVPTAYGTTVSFQMDFGYVNTHATGGTVLGYNLTV